ncbi:NADH:flavin oxidoreductase [Leucobacter chromiireducens]|uniref:NADH:flavin oxidoreductase n=1 Tax=Leucobacter chromiireducens TaxID=283877 RepID=UPI000F630214|nr:NADH:flavin oxidoreductase [Leucobacter chromiireducens]
MTSTPSPPHSSTADRTPPDPLAPAQLGPITLRNRIIKSATFEGATPNDLVSDELIEYHAAPARGGVGMTTVAYLATSPEGRTSGDQIYWRPAALPGLRRLTEEIHKTGAKVSAQIGHAGPVADPSSTGHPSLAPSRSINMLGLRPNRVARLEDLQRITRQHAEAARMARDVGFDAVEIHLGHNYLASSFLSPGLNRRKDAYGGSLANRARLARELLVSVREAVGDDVAVIAKLNIEDGSSRGIQIEESLETARMIELDGTLDALELTGGSSLLNPMYLFTGDVPVREFAAAQHNPLLRLGLGVFGSLFLRKYRFRPLYFLEQARQFQRELKTPLILLGGVTDREGMDRAMAEGFSFVAMGRALLREPDLIAQISHNPAKRSLCIHCNRCMPTIYSGTRCTEIPRPALGANAVTAGA